MSEQPKQSRVTEFLRKMESMDRSAWMELLLNYALYIILGIMIIGVIIIEPSFVSINNFTNILSQASTRAILGMGIAGLIVLQGTDLSAGRILGLSV